MKFQYDLIFNLKIMICLIFCYNLAQMERIVQIVV